MMLKDVSELAQYGLAGVSITLVVVLAWIVREFLKYMKCENTRHDNMYKAFQLTIDKNTQSANKNAKSSDEILRFMKNLNGSFKKVVKEKTETQYKE